MTYKTRLKFLVLALAGYLAAGAPATVYASDITLPKYSKDARFAPFQSAAELDLIAEGAYEEDPLTEILSINAVDVWGRIRSGFAIPDLDNPLVESHMNYFARRPEYFQRTTTRGSKYLFHIVQELEKRNMPTELALLPFIESAYNPHARSTAKAEGLWQFIPSTGRHYDLAQNAFKDERRDLISSTDAALTYLQRLYNMFGDWQLALASYNWGEGSVMRAIKKAEKAGRPITFNSISAYMPAETRNYVPKLQAVKNLIASPRRYGITLPPVENQPYFVTIGKTRDIDVKVAARLAEMSLEDFRALNSQFGPYVIAGGNEVHILLPKENAKKFQRNLARWTQPLSSWTAYQVTSPRERVEDIAARLNVSADVIRQANNIPSRTVLKFGSAIIVPKTPGFDSDIAPELVQNAQLTWERDIPAPQPNRLSLRKQTRLASLSKQPAMELAELRPSKKAETLPGVKDAAGKDAGNRLNTTIRTAKADRHENDKTLHTAKADKRETDRNIRLAKADRHENEKSIRTVKADRHDTDKAIRTAEFKSGRDAKASRVKVVMNGNDATSSKKGLIKSNSPSAKTTELSRKELIRAGKAEKETVTAKGKKGRDIVVAQQNDAKNSGKSAKSAKETINTKKGQKKAEAQSAKESVAAKKGADKSGKQGIKEAAATRKDQAKASAQPGKSPSPAKADKNTKPDPKAKANSASGKKQKKA